MGRGEDGGREIRRRENWRRLFFILSSCGRPICQDAALVSRDRVQMIKRGLGSIQGRLPGRIHHFLKSCSSSGGEFGANDFNDI